MANSKKEAKIKKKEGKIILVLGCKGGCGQSFISNCIANYLSMNSDKNILMIDFNIGKMDSRSIYKISEENIRTIFDIRNISDNISESLIKKIVINFDNSLNVIFPPLYFDGLKDVSTKNIAKVFKILREIFDIILLDCPLILILKDKDIFITDLIDKLFLVSLPDFVSLANMNIIINHFEGSFDYLNPQILINKYNAKPSISFSALNTIIKYPVEYFVPFDKDIERLYLEKGPASIFKYNLRITRDLANIGINLIKELF